ncbi:riboflavin synthase domain-like protein [Dendrothele bispora CBS 962.96]|uniref:NADPH-dependent diflavin oxidoreductase 1 n=1 Tax=Dendrothele bispora (strain CBS 962.96) TaxID=1314807 RepID=A0A4S8KYZ1_DENBC|nr:riboflavin synthase domain-like protein [Dendrothele bispora CBS 962.96]
MSDADNPDPDRAVLILYATETGNAQDVADRVARQCRRIHLRARVLSMDAYSSMDLISEPLVFFVVSTTGSGIEPRSMTPLWNMLLRSDLPKDLFDELHFAIFGLGDTSYEKFCWPAKKLARRMESLGATKIYATGEGDDQHPLGLDGALEPWMTGLANTLVELLPLPEGLEILPPDHIFPARVAFKETKKPDSFEDPINTDPSYYDTIVKNNLRITTQDWYQDVRHLEFDFKDDIQYSPGDIAVIHPQTHPDDVEEFLSSMGWGNIADEPYSIERVYDDQSLPDHLPRLSTLRIIFTRYLDFNAVPRRTFFRYLRDFTTEALETERLNEFLSDSPEGAEDLYEYCYRPRRTIIEVLSDFRNVKIPKDYIFDVFPFLRPRQFSIASSVKVHPRQIHLCVAMIQYRTKWIKAQRRGVCSMYLSRLKPGDTLKIGIQKGFIRLPENNQTPIICIGPGTGIAPMRAILQERVHKECPENTLYFGCRSELKDQHYKHDWEGYVARNVLCYRLACSRDGPEGVARTYVQNLLKEDAERIWKLLNERGAWVVISGSSNKMPAGVKGALRQSVRQYGGRTEEEAKEYVQNLERAGRLIEECWS